MRWSDQQRWLVGRCLDVFRLTTIYGVVLVLAAGPFSLLELAGYVHLRAVKSTV